MARAVRRPRHDRLPDPHPRRRPAALDRLADLRLPGPRHPPDVRAGGLARPLVLQDPGPAPRVPAEPAPLRPGHRRGRGLPRAPAALPGRAAGRRASACWPRCAASASRRRWSTRGAGRARPRQHRRPRAGPRAAASPGATTPSCSSCSTSAAILWNSVFITVTATLIMLVINSMAAFALAKYDFRGATRCSS